MRISDWSSDVCSSDLITEKLDSAQSYARVKEIDAKKGLTWLTPSKFSNTYALALPEKIAQQYPQINTISQLNTVLQAEADENHLVALDTAFANRSAGLDGMAKLYGMNLTRENIRQMDSGLVRSDERRVGTERVRNCRSLLSTYHKKKTKQ